MTLYQAGARPAPADRSAGGRWWETPYGRWRLAGERQAMARFPLGPPVVTIEKPVLREGSPHLLSGNRPCLCRETQGSQNGYDPSRTTAEEVRPLSPWSAARFIVDVARELS